MAKGVKKEKIKEVNKRPIISKNKKDVQLIWVLSIILIVILAFLGTYFYIQSLKKFEYAGVKFVKEDYGELKLFHGRFPIVWNGEVKSYYNFYLRTDPRENEIPINTKFILGKNIVISLEPEAGSCKGATMAQLELGKFFGAFGDVNIIGAVNNETVAKQMGVSYTTCSSSSEQQKVFIIQKSETQSIKKGEGDNCYIINVGDCENLKTIERLIVGMMAQVNNVEI